VEASKEDAILLLNRWRSSSSLIRAVVKAETLRSSFVGRVTDVTEFGVKLLGSDESEALLNFDDSTVFEFADSREAATSVKSFAESFIECVLTVRIAAGVWLFLAERRE